MNLYIWDRPYNVSWGQSRLCVVANSVEEARVVALTAKHPYPIPHDAIVTPIKPEMVAREPDIVLPCPCADLEEWSI
jgi:hypothetical protein